MRTTEKLWVLAKAIPSRSPTRGELICTAGINENGEWIRLYPLPRSSLREKYFKKFSKIEVVVDKWRGRHARPEDRYLVEYHGVVDEISSKDWRKRRRILKKHLDQSVDAILSSGRSLGITKPLDIIDFYENAYGRIRYKFKDQNGKVYDLACREWEARALWDKYKDTDPSKAKTKLVDWMNERDTYFVIGTTADSANPMIVGFHYPPKSKIN